MFIKWGSQKLIENNTKEIFTCIKYCIIIKKECE